MTTLILIRHGESEANHSRTFAGHINVDLTPRGMEQAETTARYIAGNYKIDKIYASDLKRAYKTAKCLGDLLGMEVEPDKNMREINAGEWEGMLFSEIAEKYPEIFSCWINDIGNCRCPGGESVRQLGERIMGELTGIAEINPGKTIVIGTHATPIRVMQCILQCGGDLDRMKDIKWVTNASVTELKYENGKFGIAKIGYDRHLEGLKAEIPPDV